MAGPNYPRFDTLSLHAGQKPDSDTGARATPIYQSTSFVFRDTDHAVSLFSMARAGHVYSRISNPTVAVLEERLAALEGGVSALATASGMAAIHLAITTLLNAGDHIVASRALYGGTHNLLTYTLPRFGITTTFVDPRDPQAFDNAITDKTKLVFAETVANPRCEVLDVASVAAVAHSHRLPLMLDATLTTPYLLQPFTLGADIVIHSLTKFLGGHGNTLGGAIVDSGNFDWIASGKFPNLSEPYEGFHGINFAEEFGPLAYLMRARREGLRDFGPLLSPTSAFQILQGVETLSLRMDKHVANTHKIVTFLNAQELVSEVNSPILSSHPDFALAEKIMPKGSGAVFSFELKAGRAAGKVFIESLQLFSHLANVGDAKSLVIHPASTTHARMSAEDLQDAGIGEGLIRLSIGLEDADDLIADLSTALRKVGKMLEALT